MNTGYEPPVNGLDIYTDLSGAPDHAVAALLRKLEDGRLEELAALELHILRRLRPRVFTPLKAPRVTPPQHGPVRKGRGGKLRRW